MSKICAIILAAGESRRMNEPKMLLQFEGKSMIEMVIGNIPVSEVFHTLVVLGAYRDEICGKISHLPVKICINENYKSGMMSSVRCGFENLPDGYDAVIVFQGDQPFIGPEITRKVIRAYRENNKKLVIPVFDNKRGHPLLIDSAYAEVIQKIPDSVGLRWLASSFPDDVYEVATDSPGILRDFDTKEDYLKEINK